MRLGSIVSVCSSIAAWIRMQKECSSHLRHSIHTRFKVSMAVRHDKTTRCDQSTVLEAASQEAPRHRTCVVAGNHDSTGFGCEVLNRAAFMKSLMGSATSPILKHAPRPRFIFHKNNTCSKTLISANSPRCEATAATSSPSISERPMAWIPLKPASAT